MALPYSGLTTQCIVNGRKPSPLWHQVAKALEPHGLTPQEYIRELRIEGETWADISRNLAEDCALAKPPHVGTIQYWGNLHPPMYE